MRVRVLVHLGPAVQFHCALLSHSESNQKKKEKKFGFVFINSLPFYFCALRKKPLFHSTAFLQIVSARKQSIGQD